MGAPKKALPAALAPNRWRPGQSGNSSGHSGEYGQAVRLACQAAPYAIHRLIALMDSLDERVAAVACNSILDRAFGKPGLVKEEKDNPDVRIANMTHEQRLAHARAAGPALSRQLYRARIGSRGWPCVMLLKPHFATLQ
jgi:hypothetical protein